MLPGWNWPGHAKPWKGNYWFLYFYSLIIQYIPRSRTLPISSLRSLKSSSSPLPHTAPPSPPPHTAPPSPPSSTPTASPTPPAQLEKYLEKSTFQFYYQNSWWTFVKSMVRNVTFQGSVKTFWPFIHVKPIFCKKEEVKSAKRFFQRSRHSGLR